MPKNFLLNTQFANQGSIKGSSSKKTPNRILGICQKCWVLGSTALKSGDDSSDLVRSIVKECGIALHGDANDIFHSLHRAPWQHLGSGIRGAHLGAAESAKGSLVVAAWKNPTSGKPGRVAIIVSGGHGYFGTLGMEGSGSPGSNSGGSGGARANLADLNLPAATDRASPTLIQGICGGFIDHTFIFAKI